MYTVRKSPCLNVQVFRIVEENYANSERACCDNRLLSGFLQASSLVRNISYKTVIATGNTDRFVCT